MNRFFDIEGDISTQLAPWHPQSEFERHRKALYRLEAALRFRSDVAKGVIVVPKGYVSDLASIPRPLWSCFLAPNDPRISLGSWIHDFLYQSRGRVKLEDGTWAKLSRRQCDNILAYEAMPELKASPVKRFLVYHVLRRLGKSWN